MKLSKMIFIAAISLGFTSCTHQSTRPMAQPEGRKPSSGVGDVGSVDTKQRCERMVTGKFHTENALTEAKGICEEGLSKGVPENLMLACFEAGPGWDSVAGCPANWVTYDRKGRSTYVKPSLKTVEKCQAFGRNYKVKCEKMFKAYPDPEALGCRNIFEPSSEKQSAICEELELCSWDRMTGGGFFMCFRKELGFK